MKKVDLLEPKEYKYLFCVQGLDGQFAVLLLQCQFNFPLLFLSLLMAHK